MHHTAQLTEASLYRLPSPAGLHSPPDPKRSIRQTYFREPSNIKCLILKPSFLNLTVSYRLPAERPTLDFDRASRLYWKEPMFSSWIVNSKSYVAARYWTVYQVVITWSGKIKFRRIYQGGSLEPVLFNLTLHPTFQRF